MNPNLPESQPGQVPAMPTPPTSLPTNMPALPAAPASMQPTAAADSSRTPQQMAEQTKQLLQQYGRDPFKLSGTFGQLKEQYLAEQYQLPPNSAEK